MQLVVTQFVSLDGVVQAPGGPEEDTDGGFAHGGWSMPYFHPETMGAEFDAVLGAADALLFGRRTWRVMADVWPGRAGDPFADRMNALPKHVASRTLAADGLDWNTTRLDPGDVPGDVRRLRERDGGTLLVMGSPGLAATLIAHDLVDEYRLMIVPITLGGGKRVFPDDGVARPLELVASAATPTGVIVTTYRPAAKGASA